MNDHDHHTMCPHCGGLIGLAKVAPPPCVECGGAGWVQTFDPVTTGNRWVCGSVMRRCSRGCPSTYTVSYSVDYTTFA